MRGQRFATDLGKGQRNRREVVNDARCRSGKLVLQGEIILPRGMPYRGYRSLVILHRLAQPMRQQRLLIARITGDNQTRIQRLQRCQ